MGLVGVASWGLLGRSLLVVVLRRRAAVLLVGVGRHASAALLYRGSALALGASSPVFHGRVLSWRALLMGVRLTVLVVLHVGRTVLLSMHHMRRRALLWHIWASSLLAGLPLLVVRWLLLRWLLLVRVLIVILWLLFFVSTLTLLVALLIAVGVSARFVVHALLLGLLGTSSVSTLVVIAIF